MGEWAETDERSGVVFSDAGRQTGASEALHLYLGALLAGVAVVVRVDAEAAALDGPDRETVGRESRSGLRRERGVGDEVGRGGTRMDACVRRPRSVITDLFG